MGTSAPRAPSTRPVFLPPRPTPSGRATPWPERSSSPPAPPATDPPPPLTDLERAEAALRKALADLAVLQKTSEQQHVRILALEAKLREGDELRRRAAEEHAASLAALSARLSRTAALEARVAELETQGLRLSIVRAENARLEAENARLEAENERLEADRSRLESENARLSEGPREEPAEPAANGGDDLTLIRGIGPAFARKLNAQGVTRVAQVAAWSEDDILRVAASLKVAPERIRRDGWVDSAKSLLRA